MTVADPIQGLAYHRITFDERARLVDDGGLPHAVANGGVDVLAHGWNASHAGAEGLYQDMFGNLAAQLGPRVGTTAAVGLFWPAAMFPEDDPSTAHGATGTPSTGAELAETLTTAFPTCGDELKRIGELLDDQPHGLAKLSELHNLATSLLTDQLGADEDSGEPIEAGFDPTALFGLYAATTRQAPAPLAVHGLLDPFATLWRWARDVLRILSYYEMNNRAEITENTGSASVGWLPGAPLTASAKVTTGSPAQSQVITDSSYSTMHQFRLGKGNG
jgi:hypothetical protein